MTVRLQSLFFLIGMITSFYGVSMLIPALVDVLGGHQNGYGLVMSFVMTSFSGITLTLATRQENIDLSRRETFLFSASIWVVLSLFGALPFIMKAVPMRGIDALFESVSGMTSTGATVLIGLDTMSQGMLLWRAMQQWYGGVGLVVMAMAVLPLLNAGGMQLFQTESTEQDKVLPRVKEIAMGTFIVYAMLTFLCFLLYSQNGMSVFDALVHSMTTVANGGFSTHDTSFGFFDSVRLEIIAMVFMLISSLPFIAYLRLIKGHVSPIWRDEQIRFHLGLIVVFILMGTVYLSLRQTYEPLEALRVMAFNLISIITCTGYGTADFAAWGTFISIILMISMMIGGCAGSASAGLKTFRVVVMLKELRYQLRQMLFPRSVQSVHYNGLPMPQNVPTAVMSFFFVFMLCFLILAGVLAASGVDITTALSGALAMLSNIGPGLGPQIGPTGTYGGLPDMAKWACVVGMLLGRLEIYTFFIMMLPSFWRGT